MRQAAHPARAGEADGKEDGPHRGQQEPRPRGRAGEEGRQGEAAVHSC